MNPLNDVTYWTAFVAGLLSFFSPCVLPLVPAYLANLAGESAIATGDSRKVWPTLVMTMTIKVEEAAAAGDWAYAKGTYLQTITPRAGGPTTKVDGKWLDILKRQPDGSWKLYLDCFNSNVPPK